MEVSFAILGQSAKLNVYQSVFVIKSPNLMKNLLSRLLAIPAATCSINL